ncbi:hypothetical protein [Klebsiella quasipneumoniae]
MQKQFFLSAPVVFVSFSACYTLPSGSPKLHDLKEAPDVSGWSPYRQSLCKNAGPQNTAAEVELHRQCFPSLRQFAGRRSTTPEITRLLTTSTFTLTGCGLHCRQALLPRDRKTAPETQRLNIAPVPARHFIRAEWESDARSLFDLRQKTHLRQLIAGF